MAVITYNDQLRNLLANVECVLAFDTAADFLGLTNGGYRALAQIFVSKKQNIEGTEQILVPSLKALECEERNGLVCTTVNRTIIDLLEQNGDEQIITESLANYYDAHDESFDGLKVPEHLWSRFEKYKAWAVEYYEEQVMCLDLMEFLYRVMEELSDAGVPIVFKGAMVLNLAIRDNNPSKVEMVTRDIDGDWIGEFPTMEEMEKTLGNAVKKQILH